jgi:nitrate reductase cytochrome c-type subunit
MQLQISLISCDGALASTWGRVSTTSPTFAGAKSGAGVPVSAALGAIVVLSTTSGNIAKKTDKKEVSRHERKTRMNKNGREMKKREKKDTKLDSNTKLGYIQYSIETYQLQQEM